MVKNEQYQGMFDTTSTNKFIPKMLNLCKENQQNSSNVQLNVYHNVNVHHLLASLANSFVNTNISPVSNGQNGNKQN